MGLIQIASRNGDMPVEKKHFKTMTRLKEVFAIANKKGGVAKTTTVQNLAAGMVRFHKPTMEEPECRVLVIDLDEQGNVSFLLGWNKHQGEAAHLPTVYEALRDGGSLPVYQSTDNDGNLRKGIWYCPASKFLSTVDNDLHHHMNSKMVLAKCFSKSLTPHIAFDNGQWQPQSVMDFDYVLIDCPPSVSEVTYNALGVASGLIIPVQLEGMAIQGLSEMIATYKQVKDDLNGNLELTGLLKVMTTDRLATAKGFSDVLEQQFGDKVFKTRIRRGDDINKAQTLRQTIFEFKPYSNPGLDYENLTREILASPQPSHVGRE